MASLDAKILFINIPVLETIKIIIENVDNHPSIPSPALTPNILEKLLHACTTQVPFYNPSKKIYTQTNNISMDSPLGSSISEFYISHIKNKIFSTIKTSKIYVRYKDDIFIATQSYDEIKKLKQTLKKNLVLKFTTELNINQKIPFLDLLTDSSYNDKFITSLYKKKINQSQLHFTQLS